jgi:hypothetical protein
LSELTGTSPNTVSRSIVVFSSSPGLLSKRTSRPRISETIDEAPASSGEKLRPSGAFTRIRPGDSIVGSVTYEAWNSSNRGCLFALAIRPVA